MEGLLDRFQPFSGCILPWQTHGKMREPVSFIRTMPVLDVGWNVNNGSWNHFNRFFSSLLIPALTSSADQKLTTTGRSVMNMPVVSASRFKGNMIHARSSRGSIADAIEIGSKFHVFHSDVIGDGGLVFFSGLNW